jgi:hypothetical protein
MNNNEKVEIFVAHVKSECEKHGVEYRRFNAPFVELTESIKCSGFFSDGTDESFDHPILCFADERTDWLEILVHEYCHMTQWLDKEDFDLWEKATDALDFVDKWIEGEDISCIEKYINISRDLELDNEKRSVEMSKRFDLPIDIPRYIKKSNAYVHFYNYIKITRKWSEPGNAPYQNENVLEAMSDQFNMDYVNLSEDLRNLFITENI